MKILPSVHGVWHALQELVLPDPAPCLTAGNKKTMSYALDYLANIDYDADPTVLFFKDELNVCLYNYDPTAFINDLVTRYNARQPQPEDGNKVTAIAPPERSAI